MSINENQFGTANVPDEMAHNIGMSDPDHSEVSTNVSPSPTANAAQPTYLVMGRPHITVSGPSVTVTQSKPHRAWEEGYQSPFAQVSHHSWSPLHTDAQSKQPAHNTGSQSKTRWVSPRSSSAGKSVDVSVQLAPTRLTNPQNLPLAMDGQAISPHPKHTIPQRTSSYRPRTRKAVTKEITLDDKDVGAMVTLGLSPFMLRQDMITNQNRFVRNECALARHFLRLQRATSEADARHFNTELDIYSHLEQQKSTLNALAKGCGLTTAASESSNMERDAPCADPDFLALKQAHQETSAKLEELSLQLVKSSQTTQRALVDLAKRLDQMIPTGTCYSTDTAATTSLSLLLSSTNCSDIKRKRNSSIDSIIDSPGTMPPPTPDFRNHD